MANKFGKHYNSHYKLYEDLEDAGKINSSDLDAAANKDGKYSYAEQDAANERIYSYLKEFAKKNPDDTEVQDFVDTFPVNERFEPDKRDWLDYNQEQMGRLAEKMHYNWRNKGDRAAMLNELSAETQLREKKKAYQDYKKEHPVAEWMNRNIFAPNVSDRTKKGEEITDKDVYLDYLNTASFLTPGGVGKSALKKGLAIAGDVGANAALGIANDLNQDKELGLHNAAAPIFGAGLGATVASLPKLAKGVVDMFGAGGADAGRVGKNFGDKIEDLINDTFTDKVAVAKERIAKSASDKAKDNWERMGTMTVDPNTNKVFSEDVRFTKNKEPLKLSDIQEAEIKTKRAEYAENPSKLKQDYDAGNLTSEQVDKIRADKDFQTVYDDFLENRAHSKTYNWAKKQAKGAGREAVKQTSRGSVYTYRNDSRSKEREKELQDRAEIDYYKEQLGRQWLAGFKPHGSENDPIMKAYREFSEENRLTRPSIKDIMGGI